MRLYKGFTRVYWSSVGLKRIYTSHITSIEPQDKPYKNLQISPKQPGRVVHDKGGILPQYCNLQCSGTGKAAAAVTTAFLVAQRPAGRFRVRSYG